MRKRASTLLAFAVCVVAVCLTIAGCGGTKANPEEKYLGYWELVSGTAAGERLSEDDVAQLKDWGVNFLVLLDTDGRAVTDLFGQVEDTTWDAGKATIALGDETGHLEVDGDTLTLSQGDDSLAFRRTEDRGNTIQADRDRMATEGEGEALESGGEQGATAVPLDPAVTVADDDLVTITVTERAQDEWGSVGYTVELRNNSDRKLWVCVNSENTAVNGTMATTWFSSTLLAGTNATEFMQLIEVASIDGLVDVQTQFDVIDDETFETLRTYPVTIP